MTSTRSSTVGPDSRPVAIPADVGDPSVLKVKGQVELPLHIRWSGPPKTYDLNKRSDRARVYEQVLREGTDEDVRSLIELDELLALWDELVLPGYVRRAWAEWLRRTRHIELAC